MLARTVRVYDTIAYVAGYSSPSTLWRVLIADVHDPKHMQPLKPQDVIAITIDGTTNTITEIKLLRSAQ